MLVSRRFGAFRGAPVPPATEKSFLVLFFKKELLLLAFLPVSAAAASLQVTGLVNHPGPITLDTLKPVTVDATFQTMHGPQSHHWSGPLLLDVINQAGLKDAPGFKTHMRHVIMAQGADSYAVSVAIGEIDPKGEAKHIIIALREDDKPLGSLRLIVPGDASFARGVYELKSLEIQ